MKKFRIWYWKRIEKKNRQCLADINYLIERLMGSFNSQREYNDLKELKASTESRILKAQYKLTVKLGVSDV